MESCRPSDASGPPPVRLHALGWLAVTCLAGVLLQMLQLFPRLSVPLAPLTYGRWYPVHADTALYGWCAVPLVGLLLHWYPEDSDMFGGILASRTCLAAWSLALAAGAASWLGGGSGSKPFMEWSGWTIPLLPLAMLALWVVLAGRCENSRGRLAPGALAARWLLLAALLPVPFIFIHAASPAVYPAVNPDSGGATGTSLLGSNLGLIAIYAAAPILLGLPREPRRSSRRRVLVPWAILAVMAAVFAAAPHGDVSNHQLSQVILLALPLAWAPLTWTLFRSYLWPDAARPWLAAAFAWWCLLLVTGWIGFLPGLGERFKFTQMLVAHAHLAMAACLSSAGWALLLGLDPNRAPGRGSFAAWQAGVTVHIGATVLAGLREIAQPDALFVGDSLIRLAWFTRLAAGLLMAAVALVWLHAAIVRPKSPVLRSS
ncbi:hypothetical protein GALL_54100 [mine drainage metagenome]|uniref:Cytochrome oxidase subunit I profile domain-containing protein n=1 Tax=mine drainage metagenome TaxID=410659 RepID=A0A1J5SYM6_9ZZZZ